MKTIKCKKCGIEYPKRKRRCPNCNTKKPMSSIAIIGIVICSIIIGISLGSGIDSTSTDTISEPVNTEVSKQENNKPTTKVIFEDSDLKVTYNKISDGQELGVTACYIHLKVENLTSQTVIVALSDAYANDTAVNVLSGVPMQIAPGKNSQQPFLFGYNEIFTSADEVENLEFKVKLLDQDYQEIKTTKSIKVKVK